MISAYILINIRAGKEKELMEKLKNIKDIKVVSMDLVYGEYDMVLKIETENLEKLRSFVVDVLRKIDAIEKTITLIVAE